MSQRLDHQIRTLRSLFWSPRDPEGRAFAPLAEAYLEAGDPGQALELVVEGLDRHPDFASGHLVAGRVFQATDDLDSALLAFDRVLELDPENTAALLARARISEMQGHLQEAMSRYLRLDALSPGDPQVQDAIRKLEAGDEATADSDDLSVAGVTDEAVASDEPVVTEEPPEAFPDLATHDDPAPSADPAHSDDFTLENLDDESQEPEVRTRTMAELLARQGFNDRALEIYRHLLAEAPDDAELQARVRELAGGDSPDSPPDSQEAEVGADYEVIDLESTEEVEPSQALPPEEEEEDDDAVAPLAPQWVSQQEDALADQGSPFPWDPGLDDGEEDSDPAREAAAAPPDAPASPTDMKGRTAGGYLHDLLAWVPGAVPVESLAPGSPAPSTASDGERPAAPPADSQARPDDAETPSGEAERPTSEVEAPSLEADATPGEAEAGSDEADDPSSDEPDDDFQSWLRQLRS